MINKNLRKNKDEIAQQISERNVSMLVDNNDSTNDSND